MTLRLKQLETFLGGPCQAKGAIQLEELVAVEPWRKVFSHGSSSQGLERGQFPELPGSPASAFPVPCAG